MKTPKPEDYFEKIVEFKIGKAPHIIGFVVSVEKEIANIRAWGQSKREKPAYHRNVHELNILSHKQLAKLLFI